MNPNFPDRLLVLTSYYLNFDPEREASRMADRSWLLGVLDFDLFVQNEKAFESGRREQFPLPKLD